MIGRVVVFTPTVGYLSCVHVKTLLDSFTAQLSMKSQNKGYGVDQLHSSMRRTPLGPWYTVFYTDVCYDYTALKFEVALVKGVLANPTFLFVVS